MAEHFALILVQKNTFTKKSSRKLKGGGWVVQLLYDITALKMFHSKGI